MLKNLQEVTLTGNQQWDDMMKKKFHWQAEDGTSVRQEEGERKSWIYTLGPQEMRTFVAEYKTKKRTNESAE